MEKIIKRKKFIFILLLMLTGLLCTVSFSTNAKAESNVSVNLTAVLPESDMEIYELSSPVDACYFNGSAAIVHTNELVVFADGAYKTPVSLISPKQVNKLNDDYLIVSQDGSIYSVKISDLSISPLTHSQDNILVGCNNFDSNENFIVTAFSQDIKIYPHQGLTISAPTSFEYQIDLSSPIAINDKGEIFYVHHDKLCKCTTTDKTEILISNDNPTEILADDNFVYMIVNGEIVRITTSGENRTTFQTENKYSDYDLGNLSTPVSLSFKGENILIADNGKNAVQEFSLNESDNSLSFTGFAIAENKTAFNRVGKTVKAVDVSGDTIAVLDDFKLTVITKTGNGKTYKNYLQSTLGNVVDVALGKEKILCIGSNKTSVIEIDSATGTISSPTDVNGKITSISEKYGKFYLATINNANISLLSFDGKNFDTIYTFENAYDAVYNPSKTPLIVASEDGSFYITHPVENKIYQIKKSDSGYSAEAILHLSTDEVIKMDTDLNGDIFCLTNDSVVFTDGTNKYTANVRANGVGIDTITSFGIDENNKEIYFSRKGYEGLYQTVELPNFAMASLKTDGYVTSGTTADITKFKTFTTDSEYIFSVLPVAVDQEYTFKITNAIATDSKEYLLICTFPFTESIGTYTKTATFSILAGQTENYINLTFITVSDRLTDTTQAYDSNQSAAFIITDVNMYYFPIISMEDTYTIKNDDNLRLTKGTEIQPIKTVSFLGKDFFYASIVLDGNEVFGFVPINFTTKILDEDVITKSYTLEKVKPVIVKDSAGNEKKTLSQGEIIRLYDINDGVATIEYLEDGIWKQGYIDYSKIIKTGNTTIRNAIVIILMTASVSATSVYFILKKKQR